MTRLYLWHADLVTELNAVDALTTSVTDPDSSQAFAVFRDKLQTLVDQGPPSDSTLVDSAELPWRSRVTPADIQLLGFSGGPIAAPVGSRLTVHSTMQVKLRPILLRAPRPSFDITDVATTIVVERPDGTEDTMVLPLFRGNTFVDISSMPSLSTFGAVVEAVTAVAFSVQVETVRRATDFDEWDELYRARARRLGAWHADSISGSKMPSRTLHEPVLPPDLFIRAKKVEDRPKRGGKSA